jgi:hypothetical protein
MARSAGFALSDTFAPGSVKAAAAYRAAKPLSALIAACTSLASVGKVMFLDCTVVSIVT